MTKRTTTTWLDLYNEERHLSNTHRSGTWTPWFEWHDDAVMNSSSESLHSTDCSDEAASSYITALSGKNNNKRRHMIRGEEGKIIKFDIVMMRTSGSRVSILLPHANKRGSSRQAVHWCSCWWSNFVPLFFLYWVQWLFGYSFFPLVYASWWALTLIRAFGKWKCASHEREFRSQVPGVVRQGVVRKKESGYPINGNGILLLYPIARFHHISLHVLSHSLWFTPFLPSRDILLFLCRHSPVTFGVSCVSGMWVCVRCIFMLRPLRYLFCIPSFSLLVARVVCVFALVSQSVLFSRDFCLLLLFLSARCGPCILCADTRQ